MSIKKHLGDKTDFWVFTAFTIAYTTLHTAYMFVFFWLKRYLSYQIAGDGTGNFFVPNQSSENFGLSQFVIKLTKSQRNIEVIVRAISCVLLVMLIMYLLIKLPKIGSATLGMCGVVGVSRVFLLLIGTIEFYPGESFGVRAFGRLFWSEHSLGAPLYIDALDFMLIGFGVYLVAKLVQRFIIPIVLKRKKI